MNQITIDREGAARLLAAHQMTDERPLWHALSRAAAGDFAPLRALVGEDAPAEAPAVVASDFREGDVVFVANGTGTWTVERVGASILVRQGNNTWDAAPESLTLMRRRHFRAGERCPVAVGQERTHPVYGHVRFVGFDGVMVVYESVDGKVRGSAFAESAARFPLAADFTLDTAVQAEVPNA